MVCPSKNTTQPFYPRSNSVNVSNAKVSEGQYDGFPSGKPIPLPILSYNLSPPLVLLLCSICEEAIPPPAHKPLVKLRGWDSVEAHDHYSQVVRRIPS
jgi:hypothetical protein